MLVGGFDTRYNNFHEPFPFGSDIRKRARTI
jgi:hypothetical protein